MPRLLALLVATSLSASTSAQTALASRDVRAGLDVVAADGNLLLGGTASMTVRSRPLGPFAAQVGGTYSRHLDSEAEVAGITLGLGLVRRTGGSEAWVMANAWGQIASNRATSPAASLGAGLRSGADRPVGVFVQTRVFVSDLRAQDAPAGLAVSAQVGANVAL